MDVKKDLIDKFCAVHRGLSEVGDSSPELEAHWGNFRVPRQPRTLEMNYVEAAWTLVA